jgi:TRAP-type C4-dicarboxylate transport system permease small subunit
MFGTLRSVIETGVAFLATLLKASLVASALFMLACITLQVVMRYVFGRATSWSEELAILMFAWMVMGGLALGVREGFHVRIDLLLVVLPDRLRPWAESAIEALTAVFGFYLAWSGWRFLDITAGSVSASIGYPIEVLHGLAPISGALIGIFATWRILNPPPPGATSSVEPGA